MFLYRLSAGLHTMGLLFKVVQLLSGSTGTCSASHHDPFQCLSEVSCGRMFVPCHGLHTNIKEFFFGTWGFLISYVLRRSAPCRTLFVHIRKAPGNQKGGFLGLTISFHRASVCSLCCSDMRAIISFVLVVIRECNSFTFAENSASERINTSSC